MVEVGSRVRIADSHHSPSELKFSGVNDRPTFRVDRLFDSFGTPTAKLNFEGSGRYCFVPVDGLEVEDDEADNRPE